MGCWLKRTCLIVAPGKAEIHASSVKTTANDTCFPDELGKRLPVHAHGPRVDICGCAALSKQGIREEDLVQGCCKARVRASQNTFQRITERRQNV